MLLSMLFLAEAAMPSQTPADIFAGVTGSCFASEMPGGAVDTHCFTEAVGGKLVMDVHKVVNGEKVVYEGVTTYSPGAGAATFTYCNSLGQIMPGTAARNGDALDFAIRMNGAEQKLHWKLTDAGYDVVMGGSVAHFVKTGPAPAGGL